MAGGRCRQKICAGLDEPAQSCIFTGGLLSVHYYSGEAGEAGCLIHAGELAHEVKGTASGFFNLNFFF